MLAAALALMDAWFVDYAQRVKGTNVAVANHMVAKGLDQTMPQLNRAGAPTTYRRQTANIVQQYPVRVNKTFYSRVNPADGVRFDYRIKTVRLGSEQTVRNIVRVGMRRGWSADQIASDMRVYLRSEFGGPGRRLSPTELQREAALLNRSAKPRNISTNKLPYSAKRIARSEAGNTYRAAEVEMYKGTVFEEDEYDWVLSNTHIPTDECDYNAQQSPYRGQDRPRSHPNCNCAFIKRPVDIETLRRRLTAEGVLQ